MTSRKLALFSILFLGCESEEHAVDYPEHGAHPIKVISIKEGIQAFSLDDDFVLGKLSDDQLVKNWILLIKREMFRRTMLREHQKRLIL